MIDERTLEFYIFGAMIMGRITWPSDNTAELISQDITKAVLLFLKGYSITNKSMKEILEEI